MRGKGPSRRVRSRHAIRKPTRAFAFGLRAALLAVLAQLVISVVHQFPHEHAPTNDAAAVASSPAGHAHHGHDHEHDPPAPANHPGAPPCAVGQMLQHMAAVLPVAGGGILLPDWDAGLTGMLGDSESFIVRPGSPAQPRAPPLTT
jgi:hypothetical protein